MARTKSGEAEAQAEILDYLALRGVFAVRLNNIPALYRDGGGALQFRKANMPVPDLPTSWPSRTGAPIH